MPRPNKGTREHSGKGRKLVGPTKYRARKASKPLMKKKAFVRQRQGVVETKSRTHEEIASVGSVHQHFITDPTDFHNINFASACQFLMPTSMLSLNQGFGEMDMLGQTVYAKALKMKINIKMPYGQNAITTPFNMYLIHGDVQAPNYTGNTAPSAPNVTRNDIQQFIMSKVTDYFDEREDKLRFIPKSGVTVNIKGYKKILNDKNTSWLADAASAPSPYKKSITWQLNKKVKYEAGIPRIGQGTTTAHESHFYPNYSRLPFCLIYTPQHAQLSQNQAQVEVAYNDCFWFTDS